MKILSSLFLILLVLSMTSTTAFLVNPQEPVKVFAQTLDDDDSIRDIGSYAVFGFDAVTIKKDVTIISGNIGVNSDEGITIEKRTAFENSNSTLVADVIRIGEDVIAQNVFFNELENDGEIIGSQKTPLILPVVESLPKIPNLPPGNVSISVPTDETLNLAPGQYNEIFVDKGATLILDGDGKYSAASIETSKEANLFFNNATEFVIQNTVEIDRGSMVGPSETSNISASDIIIFVGSSTEPEEETKVDIDRESVIDANIFAPNGEIDIDKEVIATGAFVAREIKIERDSTITLDSSIGIIASIDELKETLGQLEDLGKIIDQAVAANPPQAVPESVFQQINQNIEKFQDNITELKNKGATVDVAVITQSPGKLFLLIKFFNTPDVFTGPIEIIKSVCSQFASDGLLQYANPFMSNLLDAGELTSLYLLNRELCANVPLEAFIDSTISSQSTTFLLAVGNYMIGQGNPFEVANAFNLPAIRDVWISTADGIDILTFNIFQMRTLVNDLITIISGKISGIVFADSNGDLQFNAGDSTIPNATLTIVNTSPRGNSSNTLSNNNGTYQFTEPATSELLPGSVPNPPVSKPNVL